MKSKAFWMRLILTLTLLVWGFQNCSPDNFATQGNGTPYEGIVIDPPDTDIGDVPEPRDGTTTNQSPPPAAGQGQAAAPIATVITRCLYEHSEIFRRIRFGKDADGKNVLEISLLDGTVVRKNYKPSEPQTDIDYSDSRSGLNIEVVIKGADSVSVMYTSGDPILHTEFTTCTDL